MSKNNRMLFVGIFMIMFALLVSGATFAYFTAEITNPIGSSIIIKMDTLELIYQDTETIEVIGAFPGWTGTKTIKVKNNGGSTISYDLLWNKLDNGFNNKQDLRYSITCSSNCKGLSDTYVPYGGTRLEIIGGQSIEPGEIQTYTVKFTFRETGANQNENQGMKMTGSMTIKQTGVDNNPTRTVAEVILDTYGGADKIASQSTPDFSKPSPYITGYMAMSNFNNGIMRTAVLGYPIYSAVDYAGMYATTDQDGTTYYYRGKVDNNYVSFAGLTWRIVRINGDGTVRLILEDNIGSFPYNSAAECAWRLVTTTAKAVECAKYGYGTYASTSISNTLDTWLNENITETNLNYVATSKFCNDVAIHHKDNGTYVGNAKNIHIFNAHNNISGVASDIKPNLMCTSSNPIAGETKTITDKKIGLITSEEVALAGLVFWGKSYYSSSMHENRDYYLFTSSNYYWTMSPSYFENNNTSSPWYNSVTIATIYTRNANSDPTANFLVRPVINLKANVLVTGDGTINNKYTITGLK